MIERGVRRSCSRSCTVSGPSASWSDEKSGASARKVPCAAMWARPAPSRISSAADTVAFSAGSTRASRCTALRLVTSASRVLRSGPVMRATWPGPLSQRARRALSHCVTDGLTIRGTWASRGEEAPRRGEQVGVWHDDHGAVGLVNEPPQRLRVSSPGARTPGARPLRRGPRGDRTRRVAARSGRTRPLDRRRLGCRSRGGAPARRRR